MSRPALRAALVLALLAVLGWHVHARLKPEADVNAADRLLLTVTGPVQSALAGVGKGASGFFTGYIALVGTAAENEELRALLATTRASVAELAELRAENDRLRVLADLKARIPGRTLGASVIGRGTSARFRTLRVDRGTADGVEPGLAVLGIDGAVGRILRASAHYADVLLITDGLSGVGAVVQRTRLRAVAAGDGADHMELGYVRRADLAGVSEGDLVVTSGEDGVFPEGVPLATVITASAPETGLFVHVVVQPLVALESVEEVAIVLDPGAGPYPLLPEVAEEP